MGWQMTAFLVWLPHPKRKTELQIWWFDPNQLMRKRTDIIKKMQIDDSVAEKLTLDDLEKIYGSQLSN